MAIIQSKYWLEALSCESFTEDGLRVTPLRLLIKKMPGKVVACMHIISSISVVFLFFIQMHNLGFIFL